MKRNVLMPVIAIALAALVLFAASLGLRNIAARNGQEAHLNMMRTILPGSTDFILEPYSGEDANIRSVHRADNGYVVETVTYGYAGEIQMLIGVSKEGSVTGLVVLDMSETYGLGAQALTDHVFLSQFLNISEEVAIGTSGQADAFSGATGSAADSEARAEVDAISGATVTSKAIARSVNSAVAYVTGADVSSGATSWGG